MLTQSNAATDVGESEGLTGGRCTNCGTVAFPARPVCATCLSTAFEPYALDEMGVLYSFTVIHGRDGSTAAVGYADVPCGLRIFGQLSGSTGFAIGMTVRIARNAASVPLCLFTPTAR